MLLFYWFSTLQKVLLISFNTTAVYSAFHDYTKAVIGAVHMRMKLIFNPLSATCSWHVQNFLLMHITVTSYVKPFGAHENIYCKETVKYIK